MATSDTDREPDAAAIDDATEDTADTADATSVEDVADVADAEDTGKAESGKRARFAFGDPVGRSNVLLAVAGVLLLVGVAAAVWFGAAWARSAHDEDLDFAQQRDEAARVASATAVSLTTIDYTQLDKYFTDVANTMTPDAQKDFLAQRKQVTDTLSARKIMFKGQIAVENGKQAVAVESLNAHDGTASVMVVVSVTATTEGQPPTNARNRYILQLTRTDNGWKTSGFDPVPVYQTGQ